jgi:hypothetical protein
MTDRLDDSAPFNDDQGTRISETPTGAGGEATEGSRDEPERRTHEHRSGYGGDKGEPKEPYDPKDIPRSRR